MEVELQVEPAHITTDIRHVQGGFKGIGESVYARAGAEEVVCDRRYITKVCAMHTFVVAFTRTEYRGKGLAHATSHV
jgi:hypothetical protein